MEFSSINIQGNIISSEILDKIRSEEKFKHQSPEAFGLSRTAPLRDEIGTAWSLMRMHWMAYKKRLDTLPKGDTGTSLTREKLIIPLLSELGYELSIQRAQQVNGKSYAISHGATNRDNFPVHIMGYNDNLDKRRESGGPRLSPHALVQEYLNNTEHLFALVTNGRQLRLLRDATRLVRMSYLEFDLERMFEEGLYADFSLLFRVLHATRMPEKMDDGPNSVIEYYHQESMASGTRIREKLSEAVESSIKTLANGFLLHKKNETLVEAFENEKLSADDYYTYQLRLIYRILFLIVLEERKLVYPEDLDEQHQRFRNIYYRYYSIERLRKLTENRVYVDEEKYDLWESLKTTFMLFESDAFGSKLGIKPLGSGLFSTNALGDLKENYLSNNQLLEVLKRLTTFVGDHGNLVRVNYSDLDVEEFGSVYEGLLEYDPKVTKIGSNWEFSFVVGDDRSSSGSHYTPEELVKPLIKHSLDYIIADKLKESNPEEALLSITVCDVACGSGHILLSAARKIATELASIREGAEQPSPTFYRAAIRDVIRNCIYGVDLNPLAVELCKVALWLEAHNPNEPLNFLDHHIKNGNAIVGLAHFEELEKGIADEAFKTLPDDDKTVAAEFRKRNALERKTTGQLSTYNIDKVDDNLQGLRKDFAAFVQLPETTPAEIKAKAEAYKKLTSGKKWFRLKNLADLQVAQFFIPKTTDNKPMFTTEAQYRTYLNSGTQILDRGASMSISAEKKFFHWFLEFPQVFANGGFDCILGNPPFLGGQKLTGTYGHSFTQFIQYEYAPISSVDLVTYFFRRIYSIVRQGGFQSLISTNTVAQGAAKEGGLDVILKQDGEINHAVRSIKWPGLAAVEVSLVTIHKGAWVGLSTLNGRLVNQINSYLDDHISNGNPVVLLSNAKKSFQGSILLGQGFLMDEASANQIIKDFPEYNKVLFPCYNGHDINNRIDQSASRWGINFFDWPKEKAMEYPLCFEIVEQKVLAERSLSNTKKLAKGGKLNNDDLKKVEQYWNYLRPRSELYDTIGDLDRVLCLALTSKTLAFTFAGTNVIFSHALGVFAFDTYSAFAILQSTIHNQWAWKYSSSMKGDLRYTPTGVFETFPFPTFASNEGLEQLGKQYYELRKTIMSVFQIGLTKLYNAFHDPDLSESDFSENSSPENINDLFLEMRGLHVYTDQAVLEAYGWQDIDLRHDFYEVDYLPENDRVRYTIHPDARKELLKRLLVLNHERYEEEIKQGLHKKKDVLAYYKEKNEEVPEGVQFSDGKSYTTKKAAPKKLKEPVPAYNQPSLFEEPDLFSGGNPIVDIESKVTVHSEDKGDAKYHLLKKAKKGQFTGDYKQLATSSRLGETMLGRKVGDRFRFGGKEYEIVEIC